MGLFSERLKELRIKNGLSQERLGKQLNVTQQAVAKWEKGFSEPDMEQLINIAEILNCDLEFLIKGTNTSPAPKLDILRTGSTEFEDLDKLPPDAQKQIRDIYNFMTKQFLDNKEGDSEDGQH